MVISFDHKGIDYLSKKQYLEVILRSTHWLKYDGERDLYGDSTDWDEFDWFTREEFLSLFGHGWWCREH
jgi:hypothetical protein